MDIGGWVSGGILSIITKWVSHLVSVQTHYSDQCVLSVFVGCSTRDKDLAPSNSRLLPQQRNSKYFEKCLNPVMFVCMIALIENSQISTHVQGFSYFHVFRITLYWLNKPPAA